MKWSPRARSVRVYVTDGETPYAVKVPLARRPTPEDYDRLATRMIQAAMRAAREEGLEIRPDVRRGRIRIRRIFQAPCSV